MLTPIEWLQEELVARSPCAERRVKPRYPIRLKVRYRSLNRWRPSSGTGRSLNISSSGILIEVPYPTEQKLILKSRVEIVLEWPFLLDGATGLNLVALGRVVRCGAYNFAISIERYEFRTASRRPESSNVPDLRNLQRGMICGASTRWFIQIDLDVTQHVRRNALNIVSGCNGHATLAWRRSPSCSEG